MKPCLFCKEQIQDDAIKCRFCGSSLLPPQPIPEVGATDSADNPKSVTYVIDAANVQWLKFFIGFVTVLIAVGLALYGIDVKDSLKEIRESSENASDSKEKASQAKDDATKAQAEAEKAAKSASEEAAKDLAVAQETLKKLSTSSASLLAEEAKKEAVVQQKASDVAQMEQDITSKRDEVNKVASDAEGSLKRTQQTEQTTAQMCQKAALQAGQPPAKCGSDQAEVTEAASPNPAAAPRRSFSARELARLYNFPENLSGKGQTIGVVELGGGYSDEDLSKFFSRRNLPVPKITSVSVDGGLNSPGRPGGADGSVQSSIEILGSIVPDASILVFFSPSTNEGFADAVKQATSDSLVSILMISWGGPENRWTGSTLNAMNSALMKARTMGITVIVAAGDNGVTDGESDGKPHVDFPASSPWVLACGGTAITVSDNTIASEVVWNDSATHGGATGGGVSTAFPAPPWQSTVSLPSQPGKLAGRAIPDVAIHVSPEAGYQVFVDGQTEAIGGTTVAVPMWAGLIAMVNESLGTRVGFVNEILYKSIGPTDAFRRITQGNNGTGGLAGYSAGPGWNAAVGWGSPDGAKLLAAFQAIYKQGRPFRTQ